MGFIAFLLLVAGYGIFYMIGYRDGVRDCKEFVKKEGAGWCKTKGDYQARKGLCEDYRKKK